MEHKRFKYTLVFGFIVGFILFLASPVFAYDTFEVDCQPVGFTPGSNVWTYYYSQTDDYISGYNHAFIGWDMTSPVPYYADSDHVSLYGSFSFQIPNTALSDSWSFYVAPAGEYVLRNANISYYGTKFLEDFTTLGSPSVTSYRGETTFNYLPNNQCNLRYLMLKYNDGNYTTFSFYCLFDLNLRFPAMEMRPFRFGVLDSTQLVNGTGISWLVYNKTYNWQLLDTQEYYLLDNKLSEISNKLSNLSVSVDLTTVERLIQSLTSDVIYYGDGIKYDLDHILDEIEDLVDDTEPDPQVTEWNQQASEFESKNDALHALEESLEGTIEDFEFPTVANQTAVNNVIGFFFSNELLIALTLSAMALMIVFLIL